MISSDLIGSVDVQNGRVLRHISPSSKKGMKEILTLCEKHRFFEHSVIPTTIFSEAEGKLTFEHERVPFVTLPYEWSSAMYRDAGLFLLELLERLDPLNLHVSDIHPFNTTLHKGRFCFLDFSAIKAGRVTPHLLKEFIRHYINPTILHAKGQWHKVSALLHFSNVKIRHPDVLGYLNPIEKTHYIRFYLQYKAALKLKNIPNAIRTLKAWLLSYDLTQKRLGWGDYYKTDLAAAVTNSAKWRWKQRTLEGLLDEYRPKRVLDIAGNAGLYCYHAAVKGMEAVCFDYENEAINRCYQLIKETETTNLTPAVVDFIAPSLGRMHAPMAGESPISAPIRPLQERIGEVDMALMLALVHHLVFSQNLTFPEIVDQAATFPAEYLWIEFPTPTSNKNVQAWLREDSLGRFSWYDEAHFVEALTRHYTILSRTELEGEPAHNTHDGDSLFFFCRRLNPSCRPMAST